MLAASVYVHGRRVGSFQRIDDTWQDYVFGFAPEWLDDPDRPVLGQVFLDHMPDEIKTSGMFCWFDHLLPQGPSRRLFQRVAGLDEADADPFELLLAIGADLPGAVTLAPSTQWVSDAATRSVPAKPLLNAAGFSLPGAQLKLSLRDGEGGLVVPVGGEQGSWIAKFDDPRMPGLPTLEFSTTQWAVAAGIRAHQAQLVSIQDFAKLPEALPTGDGQVFLASRFDRSAEGSIHVEDFGQIFDFPAGAEQYHASYEALASVLAALARDDLREYVERLAFMIVSGNGDAHLKNWGVIYSDRRTPRLSPAYDLVSTIARLPRDDLALSLGGTRDFRAIGIESFENLARGIHVAATEVQTWARDARDRALETWHSEAKNLPFLASEREKIDAHIRRTPFCHS
ncbi:type II toxin-antitoxin system HipA family toxin [Enhygromyxa salina]|uniref:Serine/threonine-protein kinase HipA n=1 Tax=Enhygromyxa salina TaxID=215803 RepID=A0A2S9YM88_9BACT|nr:HipA domain-containing protein [Enhygromyxa salina]PRQ06215.1 Serine/threonine-protein kinase HipA [Enhygromyxa salina]